MARLLLVCTLLTVLIDSAVAAGEPSAVQVGGGSFAAWPPQSAGEAVHKALARTPYIVEARQGEPLPTNDWWSHVLFDRHGGRLWAYPLVVDPEAEGYRLFFPDRWDGSGQTLVLEDPLVLGGLAFTAADTRAAGWSDWLVTLEQRQNAAHALRLVCGHGLPMVWLEPQGVLPEIRFGRPVVVDSGDGKAVSGRVHADRLRVRVGDRHYGVFAPAGTQMLIGSETLVLATAEGAPPERLALVALEKPEHFPRMAAAAYRVPSESRVDWRYDPSRAEIRVDWTLRSEPWHADAGPQPLQGFLPHHYRHTLTSPDLKGPKYLTPRGTLQCAFGETVSFTYRFAGYMPLLPPPLPSGQTIAPFQEERFTTMLREECANLDYGNDTYWGGKDVLRLPRMALYAHATGNTEEAAVLAKAARNCLIDWLTYTPGEREHYFARYPGWGALVGMGVSYGSEAFTDNHFHYGYFTYGAALLGILDPAFLAEYGDMIRLVARQYANHDRQDRAFPFLRTFDPWLGHSYAGGESSEQGNNQESSSEATQSWAGLYFLGALLGDDAMRDAGAFGLLTESRATMLYWMNSDGDLFPPGYDKPLVGIQFNHGPAWATWFSGEPHWIMGIQWLPLGPHLEYLAADPLQAKTMWETFLRLDREKGHVEFGAYGGGIGNVLLGYRSLFDPQGAAVVFDELHAAQSPIAREKGVAVKTYYSAHARRRLGRRLFDVASDAPLSAVYEADDGSRRCVVFHAGSTPRECRVADAAFTAPPRSLYVWSSRGEAESIAFPAIPTAPASSVQPPQPAAGEDQSAGPTLTIAPAAEAPPVETGTFAVAVKPSLPQGTVMPLLEVSDAGDGQRLAQGDWQVQGAGRIDGGCLRADKLGKATLVAPSGKSFEIVIEPRNLARGAVATASSERGGNGAGKAVDGDSTTRWESEFKDGEWLQLDLLATHTVQKIELVWEAAHAKHYRIEASTDGTTWRTLHETESGQGRTETIAVDATARYLRIRCLKRATGYGSSLWEWRVF